MTELAILIYTSIVGVTFAIEFFGLGDRFIFALIKGIFWFVWWPVVFFNRQGNNT